MRIPGSCSLWRSKMESGNEARHVLANIEADACTPPEAEEAFLVRLAGTSPWDDARQAWEAAKNVVWGNDGNLDGPDRFYCTGRTVPDDRMRTLIRLTPVADWSRNLDKEAPQRACEIAQRHGILQSNALEAAAGAKAKL